MKVLKEGGHLALTPDENVAQVVRDILADVRENGIDAVRKYSRQFDNWDPPSFEISLKTGEGTTTRSGHTAR